MDDDGRPLVQYAVGPADREAMVEVGGDGRGWRGAGGGSHQT